jgi:hypothetical protein
MVGAALVAAAALAGAVVAAAAGFGALAAVGAALAGALVGLGALAAVGAAGGVGLHAASSWTRPRPTVVRRKSRRLCTRRIVAPLLSPLGRE